MIIEAKELKDAVGKCSAGVDAGTGLLQAGKLIFVPGYIMGCGTSINVRVPCPSVDFAFMVDKAAIDKILSKATGNITITGDSSGIMVKHGRSRLTLPYAEVPSTLPAFPDELQPAPADFIDKIGAVAFPNKSGYAGVAWDSEIYSGLIATDSIRIVTAICDGLPGGAWLPDAAVHALSKAGKVATHVLNDMPYIHVQYEDGTICSVLYRAINDFPMGPLCDYIQASHDAPITATATFNEEVLGTIREAEGFTDAFSKQMPVHITFTPGTISVRAENSSGTFCGEASWDGEYTGSFTVDASPFRLMKAGIQAAVKNIGDSGILLSLEGDGTTVLLSPDV